MYCFLFLSVYICHLFCLLCYRYVRWIKVSNIYSLTEERWQCAQFAQRTDGSRAHNLLISSPRNLPLHHKATHLQKYTVPDGNASCCVWPRLYNRFSTVRCYTGAPRLPIRQASGPRGISHYLCGYVWFLVKRGPGLITINCKFVLVYCFWFLTSDEYFCVESSCQISCRSDLKWPSLLFEGSHQ